MKNAGAQLELDYAVREERSRAPKATKEQIAMVINFLRGRNWTLCREIQEATGLSDRIVRAAAKAARPRVVSAPGSPGYKLWEQCSTGELQDCMKSIRLQRDDMHETYMIMHRAFHGGYVGGDS